MSNNRRPEDAGLVLSGWQMIGLTLGTVVVGLGFIVGGVAWVAFGMSHGG